MPVQGRGFTRLAALMVLIQVISSVTQARREDRAYVKQARREDDLEHRHVNREKELERLGEYCQPGFYVAAATGHMAIAALYSFRRLFAATLG